jgi:hypothetical protein
MLDCWHSYSSEVTNYPKKGRSEDPKRYFWGTIPMSSKALSEYANRETTSYWKHRENDLQLNTPNPLPLKLMHGFRLHYSAVSPTSRHIQETRATCSPRTWSATFTLKYQGNWHTWITRSHGSCCSKGNRRHKPAGPVPPEAVALNWTSRTLVGDWAPKLLLPTGFALLSKQQATELHSLKPLWESGPKPPATCRICSSTPTGVAVAPESLCPNPNRAQGLHCFVATRWPKPSGLANAHPQLVTQC